MQTAIEPTTPDLQILAPDEPIPFGAQQKPSPWIAFRQEAERLKATAETLTVTRADDKAGMALARTTRLALVRVRTAAEAKHKEMKAAYLEGGRQVDAAKNEIVGYIKPLEERLKEQEEFAERQLAKEQEETRIARVLALSAYPAATITADLGKMPEEDWQKLLTDAKDLHELRLERERKAAEEAARIKAEEEAERERIKAENARLKAEAAEKEKARQAELAAAAAEAKKQREAAEELLQKEREAAAERERLAEAVRKQERAAAAEAARIENDKLKAEAAAREAEAAKERARVAELERAEVERLAAEQKKLREAAAAAKRAAAAPDVEKLRAFRAAILAVDIPKLEDATMSVMIADQRACLLFWLDDMAERMMEGGQLL